jgi:hypothetical protein
MNVVGPVINGPSLDDLFSHSYIPLANCIKRTKLQAQSHQWVWVTAARVWDPSADRFPASVGDIRKFGAQAKFLRRVHPSTTDERYFVEVTSSKMERKPFQA